MTDQKQILKQIETDIAKLPRPLIVSIDGAYTAGKTQFSNQLSAALQNQGNKVQVIHYDDFHKPLSTITWSNSHDEIEAFYQAFNAEKLRAEVLLPLRQHNALKLTLLGLDWHTATYSKEISLDIDSQTIVLLEGILLNKQELAGFFDYKIFLDIPINEILKRGEQRDQPKFGSQIMALYRQRYIPVYQKYLTLDQPQKAANLVIDNRDYQHPLILHHS